jgi:hypothetical protein
MARHGVAVGQPVPPVLTGHSSHEPLHIEESSDTYGKTQDSGPDSQANPSTPCGNNFIVDLIHPHGCRLDPEARGMTVLQLPGTGTHLP